MIKVGSSSYGYSEERNILSLPFKNVKMVRSYDIMNIPDYIYFKLTDRKTNPHYHFVHHDFGINNVDIFHFFNKISFSKTPWLSTFETRIPYFKPSKITDKYYQTIVNNNCKKLIAISERAYLVEMAMLEQKKQYKEAVASKIIVIHPPQKELLKNYNEKGLDGDYLHFTIVGRDFFRKGGMEILKVFDCLLPAHKHVKLNIVSMMEYGDYVSHSNLLDRAEAEKIINKYPENIRHLKSLDNKEVIELYKRSHVSLQPSYHESYGYSILEAQACGCPVISTDVCAMQEINNESSGWVLNIPQDELKDGLWRTTDDRKKLSQTIEQQLHATVVDIINNPEIIRQKGINAMNRIATDHSPENRAELIEKIYRESI